MILTHEQIRENVIRPSFVVYMNNLCDTKINGKCVEIGTAAGFNACAMLSKSDITLVTIDNYVESPDLEKEAYERLGVFGSRVKITRKDSVKASEDYPDGYFQYAYIDGGHGYEDVHRDLVAWWPKVSFGGILAGHDWWKESVKKAVCDFAFEMSLPFVTAVINYAKNHSYRVSSNLADMCDWWIYKIKEPAS